ncbi:MAG: cation transporter [Syntrophaceae bacterium]|nr:cation transporter [Syntrophaceae bacterium]
MHIYNLEKWKPNHDFAVDYKFGEQRTRIVLVLTTVTMVVELFAGTIFGSMALLADGWHMSTHVAAFGITIYAYWYARKNKTNPDFTFSTGKVSVLGGSARVAPEPPIPCADCINRDPCPEKSPILQKSPLEI